MKRKTDFKVVLFDENKPHTTQEWWIYWVNRYAPTSTGNTDMRDFMRDKIVKRLVTDID
ncbi:hypothetical protein QUB70_28200 [Microcoleus sp. A003_D6]|uniref:hypothetical protein n=1 Tax=Microcoleus sp. A003_D6 TaxID=3055266 RepID=UPI002FD684E7